MFLQRIVSGRPGVVIKAPARTRGYLPFQNACDMDSSTTDAAKPLADLLAQLRPRLHRYLSRMTGSVLDGEDLVQEVCVKSLSADGATPLRNRESWLFAIAHNSAMDFLRRKSRERGIFAPQEDEAAQPGEAPEIERRQVASLALRSFMNLPSSQRSAVLLADVLEHSLDEAAAIVGATLSAFKASLHRGRAALQRQQATPVPAGERLSAEQQVLLDLYTARFNARDFDGLLELMAADVRLDLVRRGTRRGREALATYFGNYRKLRNLRATPGLLEGRPALWIEHLDAAGQPQCPYGIVFEIHDGSIQAIRDFHHARYATQDVVAEGPAAA
jgi:RNA polymerase sigma-70 factor (ECF subfamily)